MMREMSTVDDLLAADRSLLLVDDDKAFLTRLERAMQKRGFDVRIADSVASAMAAVHAAAPAYAVVDLRLEDGNGLDVVRALRAQSADMGIVVLTMYAGDNQLFDALDADEILQQVVDGNIAYTVTDSNQLALNRRMYPNLSIAFTVRDNLPVTWLLAENSDDSLYAVLIEFFGAMYQGGELIALEDRYFGHIQQFDYVDTLAYIEAIEQTLPQYKPWFEQYAGELDWRLLAALSYQESHWNPKAKSPTGVRGLMMLTLPTAQQMGVTSRLDPQQSIRGGSRYLHRLVSRIPERIAMPDRLWFALASYNVGWGHVEDARILTQRQGADPDKWLEVKQRLPLLRQKSVYQTTKYGYARGDEAVTYVDNIRRYYDTLLWVDERQQAEHRLEQQKQRLTEQSSTEILPPAPVEQN